MTEVKKSFPIKGMHCASCVRVTERALRKTPGVKDAVVNLATEKATVTYDDKLCAEEDFVQAIKKRERRVISRSKPHRRRVLRFKPNLHSSALRHRLSLFDHRNRNVFRETLF